jgi:SSS family solute:Na+ symporter
MNTYEKLLDPLALLMFFTTLLLPIFIGFITLKRTKNQTDFFIGGRIMNKFIVALSAISSGRSAWLILGVSGIAYKLGTAAVWAIVGYIVVEMLQFIFIGIRLRIYTEKYDSLTILDFFETRFNDHKNLIRKTGAIILAIFITAYVAAQFNAGAKALNAALGLPPVICLIISALLIMVYMMLGGYIAVAYNDVVRAIIMLMGLVILPVYGIIKIGGFSSLMNTLSALNPAFLDPFSLSIGIIIGFLGIGLGSPGQPHIIVRYMSIDDPNKLRYAAVIGTFWNVILGWGAIFIGLIGRTLFTNIEQLPAKDAEMIYLVLSSEFFGPILYGLLLGGIFAAILSTADSQLLVLASTIVRDIYEKIIKKYNTINERQKLNLSRYIVLFSGAVALLLAYFAKDIIFWLVLFAWGGLGASFGPALIFSLYWKRTNQYGITAGMISGTLMTILWYFLFKQSTGIYELIPAFACAVFFIIIVSYMTQKSVEKK